MRGWPPTRPRHHAAGQFGSATCNSMASRVSVMRNFDRKLWPSKALSEPMASGGAQIPWETTSLESDIFIFNDGQKKLSEAELEKQLEADLREWARIKASRDVKDWVAYLRSFPNGRFAEIAQTRLTRLLAPIERPAQVGAGAAVSAAIVASQPAPASPTVDPAGGNAGGRHPAFLSCSDVGRPKRKTLVSF